MDATWGRRNAVAARLAAERLWLRRLAAEGLWLRRLAAEVLWENRQVSAGWDPGIRASGCEHWESVLAAGD